MTRFSKIALLFAICFLLCAHASDVKAADPYLLGPEDVITITVLNQPSVSGPYTVAPDGAIRVPVVGEVKVTGMSLAQLEEKITAVLQQRFVNPEVTVTLREPRSARLYVFGAVRTPGAFELKEARTVIGAIAAAGGLTLQADQCRASIFRIATNTVYPVDLVGALIKADTAANLPLEVGDVLNIEPITKIPVFFAGDGIKSGFLLVPEGTPVSQAFAIAGGLLGSVENLSASISRANTRVPIDLVALSRGDTAADIVVLAGDTITVESTLMTIYVTGEVAKPGAYILPKDKGLVEVIAMAGGFTAAAASGKITISSVNEVQHSVDFVDVAESEQHVPLHDGDRVIIPASTARISVLGFVAAPGYFTVDKRNLPTVIDAIALAKGALPRAANTHVSVIRIVDGKVQRIPVNLKAILRQGDLSTNIELQPDDIVFIPETSRINWDKTLTTMVSLGVLSNVFLK